MEKIKRNRCNNGRTESCQNDENGGIGLPLPLNWTLEAIERQVTSELHHGTPGLNARAKAQLAQDLMPQAPYWVPRLKASREAGCREIAAKLVAPLWMAEDVWTPTVLALADDADWEVREWAVDPFCHALRSGAFERIESLSRESSEGVKRAIAVAVKSVAHDRIPELADKLLHVIDPFMREEGEYLRKNLGPFCVGDGLLAVYPEETLKALKGWGHDLFWASRWNTAMAFTTAKSRSYADRGQAILTRLQQDPDRRVVRAAQKATRNLHR